MRTADGIGASTVIFGGYTPSPIDRFGRPRQDFIKQSLGSEKSIVWESAPQALIRLRALKKLGYRLIAVEQARGAVDYKKVKVSKDKTVFILGNEPKGLPASVISLADSIIEVPMYGEKESLNVSVAAGIVLYRLFDR